MSINLSGMMKSIRNIMREDTGLNGDAQRIEQLGWMIFLKVLSDKEKELELMEDDYTSHLPAKYHWDEWAGDDEGMTGDKLLEFVDQKLFPDLKNLDVSDGNKRAMIIREVFEGNHNYMKSGINLRRVLNKLNELDFNIAEERHLFGDIYEGILKELQSAGKSGEFYTPRAVTQFLTDMINPQLGEKILDPACGTGGFLTCTIEHLKNQINRANQRNKLQNNVIGWEYKPLPFLLATTNLILHDIEIPNLTFDDSLSRPLNEYSQKDRVDVILTNSPFGGVVANSNEKNFPLNFRTKESADLFLILMIRLLKDGGRAGIVLPNGSLAGDGVKQRIREKWLTECNLHTIVRLPNSVFKPYATVATNLLFFEKGIKTKNIWYYEHRLPEGQKSYSKTKSIRIEEFDPIKKWWEKRKESEVAWKVSIKTIKDHGWDLDIKNPNIQSNEKYGNTSEIITKVEKHIANIVSDLSIIKSKTIKFSYGKKFKLGEICSINKGSTGIKKAKKGKYPLVVTAEERESHNEYQFDAEAVCVPLVSSTGHGHASLKRIHYQEGKFALGTILAAVIPKDKEQISAKYLYYYLLTFKNELIVSLMKGMANVGLSVTKLKTIGIFVPAIDEQLRFIKYIDKCSELQRESGLIGFYTDQLKRSVLQHVFNK